MVWLGTTFGISAVATPLIGLTAARRVITYRSTGEHRSGAIRAALAALLASALWSCTSLVLLTATAWESGVRWPSTFELAVSAWPVVMGWAPASVLLILALPRTHLAQGAAPTWIRYLDLLWADDRV